MTTFVDGILFWMGGHFSEVLIISILVGVVISASITISMVAAAKKILREVLSNDSKQIRRHASNPVTDRVRMDGDSISVHDSVSVSNSASD